MLFLAGANGSGKSTLFADLDALAQGRDFPFINADLLATLLSGIPQANRLTQRIADLMRSHMVEHKATFATETVFSDEVGAKLAFLRSAAEAGFRVVFVYVVLANWQLSRQRVAFRVREGMGHDVPTDRLARRFVASRENARRALSFVETGLVFDNSSAELSKRMRLMAVTENGKIVHEATRVPVYVSEIFPVT